MKKEAVRQALQTPRETQPQPCVTRQGKTLWSSVILLVQQLMRTQIQAPKCFVIHNSLGKVDGKHGRHTTESHGLDE